MEIVRDVIANAAETGAFKFHPLISVESIVDEALRPEAAALVGKVEASHVDQIDNTVAHRYNEAVASIDEGLRQVMGVNLWKNWLAQHYFDIVREAVGAASTSATENKI